MNLNKIPSDYFQSGDIPLDTEKELNDKESFELIRNYDTFRPQEPIDKNLNQNKYKQMSSETESDQGESSKNSVDPSTALDTKKSNLQPQKGVTLSEQVQPLSRNLSANFGYTENENGQNASNQNMPTENSLNFKKKPMSHQNMATGTSFDFKKNPLISQKNFNLQENKSKMGQIPKLDLNNIMRFLKSNQSGNKLIANKTKTKGQESTQGPILSEQNHVQTDKTSQLSEKICDLVQNQSIKQGSLKSMDTIIQQISFSKLERANEKTSSDPTMKFKQTMSEDRLIVEQRSQQSLKQDLEKILAYDHGFSKKENNADIDEKTLSKISSKHDDMIKEYIRALESDRQFSQEAMFKKMKEMDKDGKVTHEDFERWIRMHMCKDGNSDAVPSSIRMREALTGQEDTMDENLNPKLSEEMEAYNNQIEQFLLTKGDKSDKQAADMNYNTLPETDRSREVVITNYGGVSDLESLQRDTDRELPTEMNRYEHDEITDRSDNREEFIFSENLRYQKTTDSNGEYPEGTNFAVDHFDGTQDTNEYCNIKLDISSNIGTRTEEENGLRYENYCQTGATTDAPETDDTNPITTERLLENDEHKHHLPKYQAKPPSNPSQVQSKAPSRRESNNFTLGYNSMATNDRQSLAHRESEHASIQSKPLSYLDLDKYKTQSDSSKTLDEVDIKKIDMRKLESNFDLLKIPSEQGKDLRKVNYFERQSQKNFEKRVQPQMLHPSQSQEASFNISPKEKVNQTPEIKQNFDQNYSHLTPQVNNGYIDQGYDMMNSGRRYGIELPSIFTSIKESDREYISNVRSFTRTN